jgi:hypothetical protein
MKKIIYLRDYLADLYLIYVNDFLTTEVFAEYYGLEEDDARKLLEVAKKSHEQRVEYLKFLEEEIE